MHDALRKERPNKRVTLKREKEMLTGERAGEGNGPTIYMSAVIEPNIAQAG